MDSPRPLGFSLGIEVPVVYTVMNSTAFFDSWGKTLRVYYSKL